MKFRLAKILLIITLVLSIAVLIQQLELFVIPYSAQLILLYSFFTIFTVLIAYISLMLAGKQKPREVVKVVYKTVEQKQEKNKKDDKILKEKQKIEQYVKSVMHDLEKYKNDAPLFGDKLLNNLSKTFEIVSGIYFVQDDKSNNGEIVYKAVSTYAFAFSDDRDKYYKLGEGITGQVAKDKKILYIDNVPEGYITVLSGLGKGTPRYLTLIPIVVEDKTVAIIEFATFVALPEPTMKILEAIGKSLAKILK